MHDEDGEIQAPTVGGVRIDEVVDGPKALLLLFDAARRKYLGSLN